MSTKYNVIRDINGSVTGINGFGIQPSTDIFNGLLATGVAQSITVPDNYPKWIMIVKSEGNVYVNLTTTAAAPAGAFAAASSLLNPQALQVNAGQTVSLLTQDAAGARTSVEFQVIQNYQN
jgi:hypothetical protein